MICVGDEDNYTDFVIDKAYEIADIFKRISGTSVYDLRGETMGRELIFSKNFSLVRAEFESHTADSEISLLQKALFHLSLYPWFKRVWVLQEVFKSNSMPMFR